MHSSAERDLAKKYALLRAKKQKVSKPFVFLAGHRLFVFH